MNADLCLISRFTSLSDINYKKYFLNKFNLSINFLFRYVAKVKTKTYFYKKITMQVQQLVRLEYPLLWYRIEPGHRYRYTYLHRKLSREKRNVACSFLQQKRTRESLKSQVFTKYIIM